MNFSDDQASPATPAGDIFGADLISNSPTTSERVVDTQSGYLVVLKKVDGSRVALSVKRRIGTPPGTSILLTPDEQVKLSKILADAKTMTQPTRVSPRAEQWSKTLSSKTREGGEEFLLGVTPEKEFARVTAEREVDRELAKRELRREHGVFSRGQIISIAAGLILVAVVGIGAVVNFNKKQKEVPPPVVAVAPPVEDVSTKVDKFVRGFVADMLDFNAATYKASQVRAMASMTPELLEKYWAETSFPLSKAQLQATPKGQTLMITKVTQQPGLDDTREVDLFAELVSANSKISTPVHLRLKIGTGPDNQFRVIEQKDVSGK